MKKRFTKYPSNYVRANSDYPNARPSNTLFDVCHTDRSGHRITGQLYTAKNVSQRLQDLLEWGCTDITVKEYNEADYEGADED